MIVAVVFTALLAGAFAGCPDGFIGWEKERTCYHISDIPATRRDAQLYCEVFDANLVSVESEHEQYFLQYAIKNKMMEAPGDYHMKKIKTLKGSMSYWTAGMHQEGSKEWVWQAAEGEEAEPFDYTFWAPHQPNATVTWQYDKMAKVYMYKLKTQLHGGMSKSGWGGKAASWGKKHTSDHSHGPEGQKKAYGHSHGNEGVQKKAYGSYTAGQQHYRGKRSAYQEDWSNDNTEPETTVKIDESSSEEVEEADEKKMWQVSLHGDNCTVLRKCMKSHNISWYSAPCDQKWVERFFICERPCDGQDHYGDSDEYGVDYDDEDETEEYDDNQYGDDDDEYEGESESEYSTER